MRRRSATIYAEDHDEFIKVNYHINCKKSLIYRNLFKILIPKKIILEKIPERNQNLNLQ